MLESAADFLFYLLLSIPPYLNFYYLFDLLVALMKETFTSTWFYSAPLITSKELTFLLLCSNLQLRTSKDDNEDPTST